AAAHLLALRRTAVDGVLERPRSRAVPAFEEQLHTSGPSPTPASDLGALATRGVVAQLAAARTLQAPLATDHRQALEAAFGAAAGRAPYVLERSDARTPVETLTAALDSALQSGLLAAALTPAQLTPLLLDVVTVPRPFLRWAPLVEPAVVPRYRYTEGESLLRLVVRSGVDAEGVVTDPVTYGAATRAAHPELVLDWRADSQRHLAPPKTSMVEAEMHGSLDEAVGAAPAAARKKVLGIALREGGTFLLPDVADLDHPGQVLPVQGLSFELGPTADPLEGTPVPTPATLRRCDPLLPWLYAVHDIDDLQVPYLPDPLASGLSFVFPDADLGLQVFEKKVGHLGAQSLTLRYPGTWPALSAYRLVLVSGDRLDGVVEGGVVTVTLPPGEQLRLRLSSAVEPGALDLFGLWRTLHPSIKDVPQIADAAADGWLWWLTPAAEMTLVHAVPRPVTAPRFTVLQAVRQPGATTADLVAGIEVHAPSTDSLDVEASWSEWHDDVAKPAPERVTVQSTACSVPVAPAEPVVVLTGGLALSWSHLAVHHLGDTRHRTVDYVARGTTRYREFFPVQVASGKEELSLVSAPRTVRLPSTVRPPKVVVHDVLPLFRWSEETEAAQPFGVRRTRRTGVRVYLDRPWYATGDGELLAVVVGTATATSAAPSVSQWASDPVWLQSGPADASALPLVDPLHLLGFDDRHDAGRPVTGLVPVQLVDLPNAPAVSLLGYQPEYNAERQLWFLDVDLDAGAAFWPFVRLAVARYQPDSLPGLALGPVVLTDFAQLTPERSTAVARTHDGRVKVAVTGSVGLPRPWEAPVRVGRGPVGVAAALAPSRRMHVRLERRVPEVGTDLGWEVLSAAELPVLSNLGSFVTWEGLVDLPPSDPARPGHGSDLRIVVEEEERLQADPAGPLEGGALRTGSRVVYLDQVLL
ncbi:MAG: hypothetical protein JWN17_1392, partial [Frankiales bacterium]|nr:hypothetical protein [Frankiales bacterium]